MSFYSIEQSPDILTRTYHLNGKGWLVRIPRDEAFHQRYLP